MSWSRSLSLLSVLALPALLAACATTDVPAGRCPPDRQPLENCPPPEAVRDASLDRWYRGRGRLSFEELGDDPIQLGVDAEIPVQNARALLLGSSEADAIRSLAAKVHLIETARHSVDAAYYIFKSDLVGRAVLGALCDAVQRGVDVRLMVDSVGSIGLDKTWLRALHSCQVGAGFIRNPEGQVTIRRARVQVVIFNAISRSPGSVNRRSHDKMLVVDGFVPERATVMTGGRNISLAYYGILADGSPNPDTYNDMEILLRNGESSEGEHTVGEVAEVYLSLLYLNRGNQRLRSKQFVTGTDLYRKRREAMAGALAELKSIPRLQPYFSAMPELFNRDWHSTDVRLAHEFSNLTDETVVTEAVANIANNPNSIMHLLAQAEGRARSISRVVSPYLFLARYYDRHGTLVLDEAQRMLDWLAESPDHRCEMITNSVLTSDNVPAQAIVDMDMAPRMLLAPEQREAWQNSLEKGELNPELVDSETWRTLVNHPQLAIYETGRLDDDYFGGDRHYGKLHSKYLIGDDAGFVGTANFDYRSRLFNNEMGFFFNGDSLRRELIEDFESLKAQSYRWGSPEWLELRRQIMDRGGVKGQLVRNQRAVFKTLRATGLEYQF